MYRATRAIATVAASCLPLLAAVGPAFGSKPLGPESETPEESADASSDEFPLKLEYRLWGESNDRSFFAGESPTRTSSSESLHQRLRVSFHESVGQFEGTVEADFAAGRLAGDAAAPPPPGVTPGTNSVGRAWSGTDNLVHPRQAYVEYRSESFGQLSLGLQTSDWGLGLLANGGASSREQLFNQDFGGDRSFRAMFGTKPLLLLTDTTFAKNLITAVGGDIVYRDENAALREGDFARQAVFAMLYDTEATKGGTYITYRRQDDRDGDFLEALAVDFYGEHEWESENGWHYRAGAETVFISGKTNRTLVKPEGKPIGLRAWGAASELEVGYRPARLTLHLDSGYASGDGNLEDDTLTRFRFDPNYDVGLVLYDHYIPSATRASYRRLSDPVRSGEPPKGSGGFVNGGALANTFYLNPELTFGKREGLTTGIGVLRAWSAQPFLDPFRTFENGGHPVGITGRSPASRDLGWEFDLSARYRHPLDLGPVIELKTEYGVLFPGDAFRQQGAPEPPPHSALRARLQFEW
ncbi:MAG: hypothetical protein ABEL76_17240 [Bradymonadaceae bacterium]